MSALSSSISEAFLPTSEGSARCVRHWDDCASRWPLVELFDYRFLSFEMGLVKPDQDVFEHVVRDLGGSPGRLLFLDDNALNIEAARVIGLIGIQVRGVEEARRALVDVGLL